MLLLLLCAAFLFNFSVALNETVDLGYARYRGKDIGNGVLRWAGMRYARSVSRVDGLRFTAPQDPLDERNIVDATKVCQDSTTFTATQRLTKLVWSPLYRVWYRSQGRVWRGPF